MGYTCAQYGIPCNAIEVCLCETEMCPAHKHGIATHPITKTFNEVMRIEFGDMPKENHISLVEVYKDSESEDDLPF